jgi:hypothetical protein
MDPTKLSLNFSEFSTIFYAFYKFQKIGNTIEVRCGAMHGSLSSYGA